MSTYSNSCSIRFSYVYIITAIIHHTPCTMHHTVKHHTYIIPTHTHTLSLSLTHSEAMNKLYTIWALVLLLLPISIYAECTCESETEDHNKTEALKYKLVAIASIVIASAIGVSLPLLGKILPSLHPENDIFFMIKAFAAGVILATGFIHVFPDAFDNLTSPCLSESPWRYFPFTGFIAMVSTIGMMMVDTFATSYFKRLHFSKAKPVNGDEEEQGSQHEHEGHVHVHTHATHGHAHGSAELVPLENSCSSHLLRHRVISQVLELGIVVHSVIIGISLGASVSPKTIKPLVAALTFHQLFEGMGEAASLRQNSRLEP